VDQKTKSLLLKELQELNKELKAARKESNGQLNPKVASLEQDKQEILSSLGLSKSEAIY